MWCGFPFALLRFALGYHWLARVAASELSGEARTWQVDSRRAGPEKPGTEFMTQQEVEAQKHVETYKSLISISVELYKTLLLLNGGGIIALLTYIGSRNKDYIASPHISCSIYIFISGVAVVPIAFALSYGIQFAIYKQYLQNLQNQPPRDKSVDWQFSIARCLVIISIICFISG
jgi:hypothetical protein